MPKGYWIGRVDVHNEDGYKPYIANNHPREGGDPVRRSACDFSLTLRNTGSSAFADDDGSKF